MSLPVMSGVSALFTTPLGMRIDEGLGGSPADLSVRIFGPDLETLAGLGEKARTLMAKVEGVEDLRVERLTGLPQVRIVVDRPAVARVRLEIHLQDVLPRGQAERLRIRRRAERLRIGQHARDELGRDDQESRRIPVLRAEQREALAQIDAVHRTARPQRAQRGRLCDVGFRPDRLGG